MAANAKSPSAWFARRCQLGWLTAVILVAGSVAGVADEPYPTRPIRLLVGFPAGGPTDIPARFIADRLSTQLGQKVFVEGRLQPSALHLLRRDQHPALQERLVQTERHRAHNPSIEVLLSDGAGQIDSG
jgi:hypothetical protein